MQLVIHCGRVQQCSGTAVHGWDNSVVSRLQGPGPLAPEQQKIQELEVRINRLEREEAIFKRHTALFMTCQVASALVFL
jgi:hypothetical protein